MLIEQNLKTQLKNSIKSAFEEAFDEVAPRSEEHNNEAEAEPFDS